MAAGDVLILNGTSYTWQSTGGDATFTPTSLANGAGRVGASFDLGALRAGRYRVQVVTSFATAPTAGGALEVWLVRSDNNTTRDANLGASDAAVSDGDLRYQCMFVGNLIVDNSTSQQVASFEIETGARYVAPLWWNSAGQALSATASNHAFVITPIITQIQS